MPTQSELERVTKELAQVNAELTRVNKAFEDFTYIVSHDLKAPVRGIMNFSTFLMEDYQDKLGEEGEKQLQTLITLSKRISALLDALVLYSRAGGVLVLVKNNIANIIKEAMTVLDSLLTSHHAEISIASNMPTIICDTTAIRTIFKNLITNAIKFNKSDKKKIEINYREDDQFHLFSLKDNGIGISKEHYEQIFKIFRRLNGHDEYEGGTGTGLAITEKLIERHHGKVWLESVVGEGTTFYFTISKALKSTADQ